jgi:hypothetical protein
MWGDENMEVPTSAVPSSHTRGVRLATWNLDKCPAPQRARGQRIREMLAYDGDSVTLLTEVHANWAMNGQKVSMSPERTGYKRQHRLAVVQSTFDLGLLESASDHPGEQSLCLVRASVPSSETGSVLVACSVLPWRGAGRWWSGLREASDGEGLAPQFSAVLKHHVGRIHAARRPNEPIVWGGDFNQELHRPIKAGTVEGRRELRKAFEGLDLEPLTTNSKHLMPELGSIDHLAVSRGWITWDEPVVHGEPGADFPSDHALYVVKEASAL